MEPLITLQDVGVRYKCSGNVFRRATYYNALKSICFDIYPGETLGVIGKNGSGKSTILRLISDIIKPDSGHVVNRGASVSLLILQAGFNPNLNGRDNVILSGMFQGFSRKEIEVHIDEIHEYSELGDFFFEPVRTYSTGMRARLSFSISTILSPDVLLIDEVLSVGDKQFREKAERTMVSKIRSNQTVVLVTHSLAQVRRLCDRAILIDDGRSIAEGEPEKVLQLYEDRLNNCN
jgi:lipopolysaccharide transport system ATP-binding protein